VELVLAPGMVVDANELAVRLIRLAISRDRGRQHAGDAVRPPGRPDTAVSGPCHLARGAGSPPCFASTGASQSIRCLCTAANVCSGDRRLGGPGRYGVDQIP
jgi:hypothetical protein